MTPRSLDQVIASLSGIYDPQIQSIQTQQAALPGQAQAQEAGLDAKKDSSFNDIISGARSRGLGFSGIPLADQAKYLSTDYLPAVANFKSAVTNQATSLTDAINKINEQRGAQAQNIFENERNFYEQQRQFNEQAAYQRAKDAADRAAADRASAAANSFNPSYGGGAAGAAGAKSASAVQRADKGFNYTDAAGRPISAAQYAVAKGVPFRDVLSAAAKAGDRGAATALGFVGNDLGYDSRKVNSKQLTDLYNSLVWGTGKQASYNPLQVVPVRNPVLR